MPDMTQIEMLERAADMLRDQWALSADDYERKYYPEAGPTMPDIIIRAAVERLRIKEGFFYEDELPEGYPYDEMFPKSWILGGVGVRVFPRVSHAVHDSRRQKGSIVTFEEREAALVEDWGKDASKVRSRCDWLVGWGRGYDQSSAEISKISGQLAALKKAFEFVCQERNEALKELEIVARMGDRASARQLSSDD